MSGAVGGKAYADFVRRMAKLGVPEIKVAELMAVEPLRRDIFEHRIICAVVDMSDRGRYVLVTPSVSAVQQFLRQAVEWIEHGGE